MLFTLLLNLAVLLTLFTAIWAVSVRIRNAAIVDLFWGSAFVLVAWVSISAGGAFDAVKLLLAAMVTIWGTRLTWYLTNRNWGKPEDFRYQAMRQKRGRRFPIVSLFIVFWLQAVLAWVICLPIQVALSNPEPSGWTILFFAGFVIWAVGLAFESIGDYQLARFKADASNAGKVMNRGLWKYTRHPNYFGEFLVWWGLFLASVQSHSIWTIIGPLLLSYLLIRVSGVRLLEGTLRERLTGYEAYMNSTSSFFPLPPRSSQ